MRLAENVEYFRGSPYKLGGKSRDEGYDCVSLILAFMRKYDVPIPNELDGMTEETYPAFWKMNVRKSEKTLVRLLNVLGDEVRDFPLPGDLLLLWRGRLSVVGILVGQNLFLSAFTDDGVQTASLSGYVIKRAFRWANRVKQFQY